MSAPQNNARAGSPATAAAGLPLADAASRSPAPSPDAAAGPRCDPSLTEVFFTTNPGLEDVVAEEFHRRARAAGLEGSVVELSPFGLAGQVLARSPRSFAALEPVARTMRSVHHLLRPLHTFLLDPQRPLESIRAELLGLEVPGMRQAASFRVTTHRVGDHPFTSVDVQKVAGAALQERHGCAVDLEDFALNVRVDVFDHLCMVGLQLTRTALSTRYWREYRPRATLKTAVAYAMLQFAGLREDDDEGTLLDPFCGSGTILIEAAQVCPRLELVGCDLHAEAVEGARRNLEGLGLAHRVRVEQADARLLTRLFPAETFRAVVTNPPYGVQWGQRLNFARFYRQFLEQAYCVLQPGGHLVLLVWKRGVFTRVVHQFARFEQRHVRVVETGGLYPRVFVLRKPEAGARAAAAERTLAAGQAELGGDSASERV
ncbi:MAG: methyltransferase [Candidatus Latescibacterota bacterium]